MDTEKYVDPETEIQKVRPRAIRCQARVSSHAPPQRPISADPCGTMTVAEIEHFLSTQPGVPGTPFAPDSL